VSHLLDPPINQSNPTLSSGCDLGIVSNDHKSDIASAVEILKDLEHHATVLLIKRARGFVSEYEQRLDH